jgi:acetyltransferase-like isoleucine patch superfamily enzyme
LNRLKYPLSTQAKKHLIGPTIKKLAKIGANSTILPGIIVGENSLIGAGSVVTKNVPPDSVAVGNPAELIGHISKFPYE